MSRKRLPAPHRRYRKTGQHMVRVEMEPGWDEEFQAVGDDVLRKLGPQITADAQRYCPRDTGALAASIHDFMDGHALIVEAVGGDDGRQYAIYVEWGHRVTRGNARYVRARRARTEATLGGGRFVTPQPYLRPAVYQERGL